MVIIEMMDGSKIVLQLDRVAAPNTVNNFVYLANQGFYNGLRFHRVIPNFMIQGGCPNGTGQGGPGYTIRGEFQSNGFKNSLKHKRGTISMARTSVKDSAGSQFFIMHQDAPHLDGQYAAFGHVIKGLDVVDQIAATPTDRLDRPIHSQIIKMILIENEEIIEPKKL